MKNFKEKIVIKSETKNRLMIAAASICLLTGLYGASVAMADFNPGSREGLIEILSAKFNLDENEVEKTLSQYRVESRIKNQAEMKVRLEKRLNQAVIDGKINNKQRSLILAKRAELQKQINQDLKNWSKDRAGRREKMESYREEMKQWAESNGIDIGLIGLGRRDGNGMGRGMGKF